MDQMAGMHFPNPGNLFLVMIAMGVIPFIVLMVTSYVKLVVVISLVKSALGLQNVPPTMVVNGLAIILSVYIMAPIFTQCFKKFEAFHITEWKTAEIGRALVGSVGPIEEFLEKNSTKRTKHFFEKNLKKLWPIDEYEKVKEIKLLVLIPSFTVSELETAFKIGFLLFLPFVVIDLVVSNILLAMGMMMLSPMTISLPFKILLFVLADGWTNLIEGVIMTYH